MPRLTRVSEWGKRLEHSCLLALNDRQRRGLETLIHLIGRSIEECLDFVHHVLSLGGSTTTGKRTWLLAAITVARE